mmetsp:Transcript_31274/g.47233  ORF Transcript_31274/g.47233 Transcript_31274/m.47233 type:complete len:210 (-) Transcript_31274:209-838(-)
MRPTIFLNPRCRFRLVAVFRTNLQEKENIYVVSWLQLQTRPCFLPPRKAGFGCLLHAASCAYLQLAPFHPFVQSILHSERCCRSDSSPGFPFPIFNSVIVIVCRLPPENLLRTYRLRPSTRSACNAAPAPWLLVIVVVRQAHRAAATFRRGSLDSCDARRHCQLFPSCETRSSGIRREQFTPKKQQQQRLDRREENPAVHLASTAVFGT